MEKNEGVSAALDAVAASRRDLARRIYTPWWYHPLVGIFAGVFVLVSGGLIPYSYPVMLVALVAVIGISFLYRSLSGVDLNGPNAPDGGPRGKTILVGFFVLLAICFAASYLLGANLGWAWAPWVLAVLVLPLSILAGRSYDRQLRSQIEGEQK